MNVIIAFLCGALLLLLADALRRRYRALSSFEPIVYCTRPVNINHLRLCLDGLEEAALREQLSPGDFRKAQRERRQMVAEYLGRMMFNVRLLMRYQTRKMKSDGVHTRMHRDLAIKGMKVWFYALVALFLVRLSLVFPKISGMNNFDIKAAEAYTTFKQAAFYSSLIYAPEYADQLRAAM